MIQAQVKADLRSQIGDLKPPVLVLTCWKCRKHSIPAPAGATAKTKYVCAACTRVGFVPDDERQYRGTETFRHRAHQDVYNHFAAQERHLGEPRGVRMSGLERQKALKSLSAAWLEKVCARKSEYIARAWRNSEPWVLGAKIEYVIRLPRRRLCALLLVAFLDTPYPEAAIQLGTREQTVRMNVMLAKRDLEAMVNGAAAKKFYERTHPKKIPHLSTEAYAQ